MKTRALMFVSWALGWVLGLLVGGAMCASSASAADADMRVLRDVHKTVMALRLPPDRELWAKYGRNQYAWDYSDQVIQGAWWVGDCSEYAMTVRGYLVKRFGYTRDEFQMLTCDSNGTPHRVLKVRGFYTDINKGPSQVLKFTGCYKRGG